MTRIEANPAPSSVETSVVDRDSTTKASALKAAAFGAGAAGLMWAAVAFFSASHGLDPSDESFYLLTYRWWNVNHDNFTGAQYVYGPVFQLLHHDIAALRIFKLVTLLVAHGLFGWTFMSWLRLHRPRAPKTRWWEAAGTAAIIASAGAVYSWLPLSPGYNDLSLTCAVLVAAGAVRIAKGLLTGVRPPVWVCSSSGAAAVVMLLNKWSAAILSLFVIVLALAVVAAASRPGRRRIRMLIMAVLTGVVGALAVIHFLLVPLPTLVRPLVEVNRLVAASSNSPAQLLSVYWTGARVLAADIVHQQALLLLAAAAVPFLRPRRLAFSVAVIALVVMAAQVMRHHGLVAGSAHLPLFSVTLFTPLVVVGLCGAAHVVAVRMRLRGGQVAPARRDAGQRAILLMLTALPVTQAAGTGNPIHYLAVAGLGIWMAVAIAIFTSVPVSDRGSRTLIGGALAALLLATSAIAVDGLWNRPYRTTGHEQSTMVANGVPSLASLRLDPDTAQRYVKLRTLLEPYIVPSGRAMMGFDGIAGAVLALDGRPVGEAWYPGGIYATRSAAGIRRACAHGAPWWGNRDPVILFNRPDTAAERRALRFCGLSLRKDYHSLYFPGVSGGDLEIYVPDGG